MNTAAAAISRLWLAAAKRSLRRLTAGGSRRLMIAGRAAMSTLAVLNLATPSPQRPLVVNPSPRGENDDERDAERDREQDHRHCGGVAHVEVAEPVLVEEDREEQRRVL